jgi:hypothetical protein
LQQEPQVLQPVVRAERQVRQVSAQLAEQVLAQRELPLSLQVLAQEPQVWEAQQPQAPPVQQPAATAPPLLPRPSLLSPP